MGRASMPSSVCSCRNVNCVGPNVKAFGFSTSIAWVVGVSGREDTTRLLKPLGGPSNPSISRCPGPETRRPYFVTLTGRKAYRSRKLNLLFPLGLGALLEFFAGHVLLVGGDPPRVAERVLHARAPVSVECVHRLPQGGRPRLEGPWVRRGGVRHVQEQRHLDRLPLPLASL